MDEVLAAIEQDQEAKQRAAAAAASAAAGGLRASADGSFGAAQAASGFSGGALEARFAAVAHLGSGRGAGAAADDEDDGGGGGCYQHQQQQQQQELGGPDGNAAYAAELGMPADPWELLDAAAAAEDAYAGADGVFGGGGGGDTQQGRQQQAAAQELSVDSKLWLLPDNLSDFGDAAAAPPGSGSPCAAACAAAAAAAAGAAGAAGAAAAGGAPAARTAAGSGGSVAGTGAPQLQLPSHISAFGDDFAGLVAPSQPELSTSDGLDEQLAAGERWVGAGGAVPCCFAFVSRSVDTHSCCPDTATVLPVCVCVCVRACLLLQACRRACLVRVAWARAAAHARRTPASA
jgi:hypothetical protein